MNTIDITIPNYGTIRGTVDAKLRVAIFRNVPYAYVPERWRVAVKPQSWSGVRDATVQGPVCPQGRETYPLLKMGPKKYLQVGTNPKYEFAVDQSEQDSLNMNIFVPLSALEKGAEPVPVMTWVHGGAFRNGSNCIPLYVVTINYRVGVFGFIASKELQQEMEEFVHNSPSPISLYDQSIGNWGLQDQRLAFEWVRANISALGGNGRNVTAWGEAAGSVSLHYHMLIPSHFGLFDHAIMQSGVVGTMPAQTVELKGQAMFDKLLKTLNIPAELGGLEKVKRLRAVSMDDLTLASETAFPDMVYGAFHDGGKLMPSDVPMQTLSTLPSSYDPNIKSIMIGSNRDEGSAFALAIKGLGVAAYPRFVSKFVLDPKLIPLFQSVYGAPETDAGLLKSSSEFIGDMLFHHPIEQIVDTLVLLQKERGGAAKFSLVRYHYDVELSKMRELVPSLKAMHVGELPIIFGPPMFELELNEDELRLSLEIQKRWIAFAHQQPVAAEEADRVANAEKDEAIVWTKDYTVEVGKGRRLNKDAQGIWDAVTNLKLQKVQQVLDCREQ
ncbi:Cocaine esterase [Linnemannia zychae]|nr:Cocaine esterase [Linnemannia zychae]